MSREPACLELRCIPPLYILAVTIGRGGAVPSFAGHSNLELRLRRPSHLESAKSDLATRLRMTLGASICSEVHADAISCCAGANVKLEV
jgi:hypothetical protein